MRSKTGFQQIEARKTLAPSYFARHGKLGIFFTGVGVILLFVFAWGQQERVLRVSDFWWSALLSIPITAICMGIFSVFYEYYMRNTFANSMRSIYWAWDTGVTVFPSHAQAPDRKEILAQAKRSVCLMSTTFMRYFIDVRDGVEQKLKQGVEFKFIIYDPSSRAVEEKAREEGSDVANFQGEIVATCRRYLGPLVQKYPTKISVRFCDFNAPFAITVVDEKIAVLSLNVYGLARDKNQTPCLAIENTYDDESVFKLYKSSFDAIWDMLKSRPIPKELESLFANGKVAATNVPVTEANNGKYPMAQVTPGPQLSCVDTCPYH